MGRIAKLLSFVRSSKNNAKVSDVKVDPGGGANITAEHFSPAGDDSSPLPGDYVALNSDSGAGRYTAIGYIDPLNDPKSNAGDKRIYARDESTGVVVAEFWLKNTGEISCSNGNGYFALAENGDFIANGVIIGSDGKVEIPESLTLNGKEIAGHDHAINSGSSAPGPTGENN